MPALALVAFATVLVAADPARAVIILAPADFPLAARLASELEWRGVSAVLQSPDSPPPDGAQLVVSLSLGPAGELLASLKSASGPARTLEVAAGWDAVVMGVQLAEWARMGLWQPPRGPAAAASRLQPGPAAPPPFGVTLGLGGGAMLGGGGLPAAPVGRLAVEGHWQRLHFGLEAEFQVAPSQLELSPGFKSEHSWFAVLVLVGGQLQLSPWARLLLRVLGGPGQFTSRGSLPDTQRSWSAVVGGEVAASFSLFGPVALRPTVRVAAVLPRPVVSYNWTVAATLGPPVVELGLVAEVRLR